MHKYRSQGSYQAGGIWEGDGEKSSGQNKNPNTNNKLYTTTTLGPVGEEMRSGLGWRERGGGGVWDGEGCENNDGALPCLEMNELASEPRSLYPALKDKEGNKQRGRKEQKRDRVNRRAE